MVAQIPLAMQGMDAFSALGLGLLLAAGYDLLRFIVGSGRVRVFFCDLLAFALGAVGAVSFSVSYSYTGALRWYMLAGMGVGYAAYFFAVAPFTAALRAGILWVLLAPWRLLHRFLWAPLAGQYRKSRLQKQKKRRNRRKTAPYPLQASVKVLYNSN